MCVYHHSHFITILKDKFSAKVRAKKGEHLHLGILHLEFESEALQQAFSSQWAPERNTNNVDIFLPTSFFKHNKSTFKYKCPNGAGFWRYVGGSLKSVRQSLCASLANLVKFDFINIEM